MMSGTAIVRAAKPPQAHRRAPVRVALIGCGAIAQQMHLPILAGHKMLKLAALVDCNLERARKFAHGYGVEFVLDDPAKLTRDIVEAAIVATPPSHHAPCTIDLVRKGIHVLVEKPMATNLADAEQMVAEAERAGVVLSVGYFRRLNASIRLMRALLDSDWPGRPQRFHAEGGGMYNWSAATLGNMRRDLAGGGVLIDFGSHMVDLLFALFDEPAEVLEYRDNSLGGIDSDCTVDVRVHHAGRPVEGRIELARTRELDNTIRVECERAMLEFQVNERFRIRVIPYDTELIDPISGRSRDFWFDASWGGAPRDESWYATFARQFDDWIEAIETKSEPVLSGRSALATSRLITACYRNQHRVSEQWVWRGIPAGSMSAASSNGQPSAPPVHVAGRAGRVLVTGASGFIGCRVVELLRLREHCDVRAAVHNPGNASRLARLDIEMVQADLASSDDVRRLIRDCDSVVHCAIGTTYGEPRKIREVTVGGTRRLVEAALAAGVKRFVHVSTMSVYGDDGALQGVIDENTPVRPVRGSLYSETKSAAERAVLKAARRGLAAAVFRPARVFGPFSRVFITRPLQAIAAGSFRWLGSPDVPADMVYVDNVAEALLSALFADAKRVAGEVFNIGDGDNSSWREFYEFFAERLELDLTSAPIEPPPDAATSSGIMRIVTFPGRLLRGVGQVITSPEFKSLGRRVLSTEPVGTMPRKALERFPLLERGMRKVIRADDSLPIYRPEARNCGETVHMGSGGSTLSITKLRDRLGFVPPVPREEALQLTLDWVRHARIV